MLVREFARDIQCELEVLPGMKPHTLLPRQLRRCPRGTVILEPFDPSLVVTPVLSGEEHERTLKLVGYTYPPPAVFEGEAHMLYAATATQDAHRFMRLMTLWFLYMCRLGLSRYMHRTIGLLHRLGIAYRRCKAVEVWSLQRNVINEAIECRRFLSGEERNIYPTDVCEHGSLVFPRYRHVMLEVPRCTTADVQKVNTLIRINPQRLNHVSEASEDRNEVSCSVTVRKPRQVDGNYDKEALSQDSLDSPEYVHAEEIQDFLDRHGPDAKDEYGKIKWPEGHKCCVLNCYCCGNEPRKANNRKRESSLRHVVYDSVMRI